MESSPRTLTQLEHLHGINSKLVNMMDENHSNLKGIEKKINKLASNVLELGNQIRNKNNSCESITHKTYELSKWVGNVLWFPFGYLYILLGGKPKTSQPQETKTWNAKTPWGTEVPMKMVKHRVLIRTKNGAKEGLEVEEAFQQ